jgi:hypothetical protein
MIGFTFGKTFLVFNDIMFDGIMNDLFLDLDVVCLTKENKHIFVDAFMDNYMSYLEPIFENNDLSVEEEDIDTDELNIIFNEFEEYLDWILKSDE